MTAAPRNITDTVDFIGRTVCVTIDRPLGSRHPKYPDMIYKVNYGYVADTVSGDGEELDAYVLGVKEPLEQFTGQCIAVIRRTNDNDDKLIVVPMGVDLDDDAIRDATNFQERYFESIIVRKPAGMA